MHEYRLLLKGYDQKEQREWERLRWDAWQRVLLSPDIKPGKKPRTARAFVRFPWEEPEAEEMKRRAKESRVTEEEMAVLNAIFEQIANKKDQGA